MKCKKKKKKKKVERKKSYCFIKYLLGASVPPPHPHQQLVYEKFDPGGDHYIVGCLGQTHVSLAE